MHHTKFVTIHRAAAIDSGSRLALPIAIAVALASLPAGALAQPAARPATLQEALAQIEALKKQMSDLEKFVREQA